MSVCDEGWPENLKDCPCYVAVRSGWCSLGKWGKYLSNPPDSCPHAAALKAVLENPDLVLAAVPKGTKYLSINNACLSIDEVLPDES